MSYKEYVVKKLYYSIGDTAELLKIAPSTIRFWIADLNLNLDAQKRNSHDNRRFVIGEVKNLSIVRYMIYEEGYTLRGVEKNFSKYECDDNFNVKRIIL